MVTARQEGPAPNVDVLWCDRCGRSGIVRHRDLGEVRAAYELFSEHEREGPQARLFGMGVFYEGPMLDRVGYETAIEALARQCECGGRFRFVQAFDARPGPDEVGDDVDKDQHRQ